MNLNAFRNTDKSMNWNTAVFIPGMCYNAGRVRETMLTNVTRVEDTGLEVNFLYLFSLSSYKLNLI